MRWRRPCNRSLGGFGFEPAKPSKKSADEKTHMVLSVLRGESLGLCDGDVRDVTAGRRAVERHHAFVRHEEGAGAVHRIKADRLTGRTGSRQRQGVRVGRSDREVAGCVTPPVTDSTPVTGPRSGGATSGAPPIRSTRTVNVDPASTVGGISTSTPTQPSVWMGPRHSSRHRPHRTTPSPRSRPGAPRGPRHPTPRRRSVRAVRSSSDPPTCPTPWASFSLDGRGQACARGRRGVPDPPTLRREEASRRRAEHAAPAAA